MFTTEKTLKGFFVGKLSRTKGHSFERWVAIQFRKLYPDAKRHLEYQASEANGIDLVNTGPFRVQCKRGKKYASVAALKEIEIDPFDGGIPLLVTKADNSEPLAVLPLDDFLRLVSYGGARLE